MTQNEILNVIYSLRAYCVSLDPTLKWYTDDVNETITDDACVIVKSVNTSVEDNYIRSDFLNLAVLAKDKATSENIFSKLFATIQTGGYIPVKDYKNGTLTTLFNILITRRNWDNIGNTDGYFQKNITLGYEIIEN